MSAFELFWKYISTNYPYLPHGYCFYWNPILMFLNVISDAAIGLAYFFIPASLVYITYHRKDIPFNSIFIWFGLFIVGCGVEHIFEIITLWYPFYWGFSFIKVVTACTSLIAAVLLINLLPRIRAIPSLDSIINANKKLKLEIKERIRVEKEFRDLLEGIPDAIVIFNTAGAIILVNAKTETMFGYLRNELLGKNIELLIPEKFTTKDSYLYNSSKITIASNIELEGVHKNKNYFPVEINLAPVEINEGILTLATIRDITERKRIEKMKSEFVSIVSHELRTPLTSIYGAIELLNEDSLVNNHNTSKQLLSIAKKNSRRLIRLINDILDLEKIDSGQMKMQFTTINFNILIAEAIASNQPYADKFSVKVNYSLPYKNMIIQSDRDRLMQVITNLISNAFKFSPPDSIVKINVAYRTSEKIRVEIIDHGPGIPEKFHPHVFEKFCQADSSSSREYAGTGLGLSISKSIIEKLHGSIGFITKENEGTTFYFEIPTHYDIEKISLSEAVENIQEP